MRVHHTQHQLVCISQIKIKTFICTVLEKTVADGPLKRFIVVAIVVRRNGSEEVLFRLVSALGSRRHRQVESLARQQGQFFRA